MEIIFIEIKLFLTYSLYLKLFLKKRKKIEYGGS